MRQRLGLAVALLRQPPLLLLDEPANGMDPAGIREFRRLLRSLADTGTTVFLSSHLLAEVEQVCDQVAVLHDGRLIEQGRVAELTARRAQVRVVLRHGRRWPVLAAKLASLWLAGVALLAACWLALAAAGPVLSQLDQLPAAHQSLAQALSLAAPQVGRALLVLAMFAAIGLLSATLTRNTIGTMATTAGIFVGMLLVASWPGVGRWSPATWVQSWMRFPAGLGSVTFLPTNFWSRFISSSGATPGQLASLAGLLCLLAACLAVTVRVFSRADVSG